MSNLPLNDQQTGQPANDAGYAALMAVKPGERLRKARKERQLDIDSVAEQLNLSPSVVKAIEEDAYNALPSSTFVKGYIRSYARMLCLPGDDLVRAFEYQTGVHSSMDEQHPLPAAAKKSGFKYLMLLLLVVGAVAGWLVFENEPSVPTPDVESEQDVGATVENQVSSVAAEEAASVVKMPVKEPVVVVPEASSSAPAVAPKIKTEPVGNSAQKVAELPVEVAEQPAKVAERPADVVDVEAIQPVADDTPAIQANESEALLVMIFRDDCWVEIRNESNKLIHADLHRAGSQYSKKLAPPFDIKLGNGNAVKLSYNGEPVVFAQSKRSKVANLSIGR